jgi:hypothetical protein
VGGSKSFLDSNSYVAKAAFLILVVIIFVYVLRLCIAMIGWLFAPSSSPYLVNGVIDANVGNLIVPQDPSKSNAVPIIRSVNDEVGIAFTWSAWLFIKQHDMVSTSTKSVHHVFNKGSANASSAVPTTLGLDGIMFPNNAPGVYLTHDYSGLIVVMSTFDNPYVSVEVDNIPINKWFNVIIRVENTVLDVFINGALAQRLPLNSVPFQNYGRRECCTERRIQRQPVLAPLLQHRTWHARHSKHCEQRTQSHGAGCIGRRTWNHGLPVHALVLFAVEQCIIMPMHSMPSMPLN